MKTKSKKMNILLWVLQVLFALYYIAGGIYMAGHYGILVQRWAFTAFPKTFWIMLGALEVILALGLILFGALRKPHKWTAISAICLAVISLLGSILYAMYTGMGILWAVVPAFCLAFIAYKRWR